MKKTNLMEIGKLSLVIEHWDHGDVLQFEHTEVQQDHYYSDEKVETEISVDEAKQLASHLNNFTQTKPKSPWVSVDDGLPKLDILQSVLVLINNDLSENLICEAVYHGNGDFICPVEIMTKRMRPIVGVTHFICIQSLYELLPMPPKGE